MSKPGMLFVTNLHFKANGNGGQQRTYFLLKELSRHFDMVVISPYAQIGQQVEGIDATFIESQGVKARKMLQTSLLGRVINKMFDVAAKSVKKPNNFVRNFTLLKLKRQLDAFEKDDRYGHVRIIVFDTTHTVVNLDTSHWNKRILNAHNFDFEISQSRLLEELQISDSSISELKLRLHHTLYIKKFEFDIDSYFDSVWTCSKSDIEKFKIYNPDTKVDFECLPNGSDTESRKMQFFNHDYKKLLFVGSLNYFPNVNGLQWFVDSIFKNLPSDFQLTIVGKSPKAEDFKFVELYDNIKLVGEVDDVEPYYASHDVVIVPILEGSGTRLKILEAFSYGKLVLSTSKGIEGIAAKDGMEYIEFDNWNDFDQAFVQKLDRDRFETIRRQSRVLVENRYSWQSIVSNYYKKLYEV